MANADKIEKFTPSSIFSWKLEMNVSELENKWKISVVVTTHLWLVLSVYGKSTNWIQRNILKNWTNVHFDTFWIFQSKCEYFIFQIFFIYQSSN